MVWWCVQFNFIDWLYSMKSVYKIRIFLNGIVHPKTILSSFIHPCGVSNSFCGTQKPVLLSLFCATTIKLQSKKKKKCFSLKILTSTPSSTWHIYECLWEKSSFFWVISFHWICFTELIWMICSEIAFDSMIHAQRLTDYQWIPSKIPVLSHTKLLCNFRRF